MVQVEIDERSGFCFGVVTAIQKAEQELEQNRKLYCLGDIVHNSLEVRRLNEAGLTTIDHTRFATLKNCKVLLRAHGEPPQTYEVALQNGIEIIDATCPVVLRLQKKIKACYEEQDEQTQIVIYGKIGHAEVNGLVGQTEGKAIVIEKLEDIEKLDFNRPVILFSQTTKPLDGFEKLTAAIKERIKDKNMFEAHDTVCRQVSNRLPQIKEFATKHDWIYFVAGEKSSNGRMLFEECKKQNPHTYFISDAGEINGKLPGFVRSVGVCGATSTPKWLMEKVAQRIKEINNFLP
ncbi:MAG: 4-hydroxy-3-methylbut-2-enyl diphosphate reductase [Tannerellaceae bacterium]|nr:4-hydroxy-3-methylbut-2-enyl diphosphate reductase [Tannerellaceae bacterium]